MLATTDAIAAEAQDPNRAAITAHLEMLHTHAKAAVTEGVLVLVGYGEDPITGKKLPSRVTPFPIGDVTRMVNQAMAWTVLPHVNVYTALVVMRSNLPAGSRGGNADIVTVLGLVADFDDNDAANWPTRIPIAPSVVLETSPGRFQTFFQFDRGLDPVQAEKLAKRLQATARCDYGTGDIVHVWRIAGTLNWPNKKKADAGRSPEPVLVVIVPGGTGEVVNVEQLDAMLKADSREKEHKDKAKGGGHQKGTPLTEEDKTRLILMFNSKNGGKIKRLHGGDHSDYPSQSEGDSAFCFYLAYWFERDPKRMDRVFRHSRLMRQKWDERHGANTYGVNTIADACENVTHTYQEPTSDSPEPAPEPEPTVPFTILTGPASFISRYVAYAITRTDAPPEAHEALAFGILSVLASNVRLPIATSSRGWSLVLWIIYLVNSTAGRKSTTLDLAVDLLRQVIGVEAVLYWEGSPQGFIQHLQERDGQANVFVRDEYSSLMAAFNKNGHLSGLPQVLIKAFDGSPLENIRTKKKGADGVKHSDSDRVERPFLAQFSAAPWDAFVQRATIDNVLDGFLARFIVITGAASGRELPLLTPSITKAHEALYKQANTYCHRARTLKKVIIAPEVMTAQWMLEQDFLKQAAASVQPDAAAPSLKRLAETALKVAALLALEEATGGVLSIQETHFILARSIVTRWAKPAVRLVEALGASTFQRDCARVWQTIHHRTVVTRSALYRAHRRLRKREFDEILEALEMQGRIRIDETKESGAKGRPAYTIHPVGGEL